MDGLMDQIFSEDPYLAFQPAFAYTLPIQLLVSGITLTLLCVLAIHLICTSTLPLSTALSVMKDPAFVLSQCISLLLEADKQLRHNTTTP